VAILAIETGPIEKFHQPVDHVAGAMSSEMIMEIFDYPPDKVKYEV
jgi:hypothetical protein